MGQSMPVEIFIRIDYIVEDNGSTADTLKATITMDTMAFSINGMEEDLDIDLTSFMGKQFGLILSPLGEEMVYSGIDTLPEVDFSHLGGGKTSIGALFRNPFPDLPADSIHMGEIWTGIGDYIQAQRGMDVSVKTESRNTLEKKEMHAGRECLKIISEIQGTLDGAGKQMGMDVVFEGDMENSTTWTFAHDLGVLVNMVSHQFMEGTIAVIGQVDMVVPMTQETRMESRLIE